MEKGIKNGLKKKGCGGTQAEEGLGWREDWRNSNIREKKNQAIRNNIHGNNCVLVKMEV